MDVLIYYISVDRSRKRPPTSKPKIAFYDSNFPASLMKLYSRLTKTAVKDRGRIKYDDAILRLFRCDTNEKETYDRVYFPFYIDKQHWVGICLDLTEGTVLILDCNACLRTESQVKKDINPITIVVPHILNSHNLQASTVVRKQFDLVREKSTPQNTNPTESGIMTARLLQAHALNGMEGCKEVKEYSLSCAAKHLALLIYRDITPA